jgi:hypothetical protein
VGDSGLGKTTLVKTLLSTPGERLQVHDGTFTPASQFVKDPDSLCSTVTWKDEEDRVIWVYRIQVGGRGWGVGWRWRQLAVCKVAAHAVTEGSLPSCPAAAAPLFSLLPSPRTSHPTNPPTPPLRTPLATATTSTSSTTWP